MDQLPSRRRAAERANALGIPTHTVKFYVDGVIPPKTAYLLAPYENSGDERGAPQIAPEVPKQATIASDARGMHGFSHATATGAVRLPLDALQAAPTVHEAPSTKQTVMHSTQHDPHD